MAKRKKIDAELDELMPILIGYWRKMFKLAGPKEELQTREFREFVSHVQELYKLDLEEGEGVYEEAFTKRELIGAYLLYFFPLKYQEALSLISELPAHGTKALDISVAPSPYPLAALKYGYIDVTSIGSSELALKVGAEAAGRFGYPLNVRQENLKRLVLKDSYDLITISHTLFDLFPTDGGRRREFITSLIQALTKDGFLIIVESSIDKKNKRFLELRDVINECGFTIQAPCIFSGRCPALAYKNMCFAQRDVEKPYLICEANRAGKINMNSLKMSYLIVRSKESAPLVSNKELYRITSPPFDESGRKSFYLCGKGGRKKLALEEPAPDTKAFDYLKRGEAIEIDKARTQGNAFVLDEESKITVVAPLSKPLIIM